MTVHEEAAASTNGEREHCINRLIKIDGIARKTAEAMCELGVHSYADLVQYLDQRSAQQISVALREHGVKRPPAFIDPVEWAKQARAFGDSDDAAPPPTEEEREPTTTPEETPSDHESREHEAVFTVSFSVAPGGDQGSVLRTTVSDRINGGQEGVFRGNDAAPWVNYILERAHLPVAVERIAAQDNTAISPIPAEPDDVKVEIGDVELSIVGPTVDSPEKRVQAEISFQLSGSNAEMLASQGIPFRMEGYTVNVESGNSELVTSEQSKLVPHVLEYVGQQEFGIPDVGRYEFHSIVLLLPPGKTATYHCGPAIRVIP